MKQRMMKLVITIIGCVIVLTACSLNVRPKQAAEPIHVQTSKYVKVAKVVMQSWNDNVEQTADVIPSIQLDVVLKTDGDVVTIKKKKGDAVRQGEMIAELDKTDMLRQKQKNMLALKSAQEQLDKAKRDLEDSKLELNNNDRKMTQTILDMEKDYSKLRNDYNIGIVTKKQLEDMESKLKSVRLDQEVVQRKLDTLSATNPLSALQYQIEANEIAATDTDRLLSYYEVKSPLTGIITDMPIDEGMTLTRGFKVAQIQQQDPLKITASLTEAQIPLVQVGQQVSFRLKGSMETMQGMIIYVSNVANVQTRTYSIEIEAANPKGLLKSGTRVQLLLSEGQEQQVLAIPASSVIRQNGASYVYVIEGNHASKRVVVLGRVRGDQQEIINGLQEQEQLVVSGQLQLQDRESVTISE